MNRLRMRLLRRWLAMTTAFFIFFPLSLTAQPYTKTSIPVTGTIDPQYEALDQVMLSVMRRDGIPGATLAIIKDGKFVAQRGYGWANVEKHEPVEPDSLFRIASVSKMVTYATALTLVQSGKLKLDDPAFVILQDLHPYPAMHLNPMIYHVTIRELLNMSVGWNWHGLDPLFGPWQKNYVRKIGVNPPWTCQTVARVVMGEPIHSLGTKFLYSNIDGCILSLVISKVVTGQYSIGAYEDYVQQALLAPLGITDMHLASSSPNLKLPNEVHYYEDLSDLSQPNPDLINFNDLPYGYDGVLANNAGNGGWAASSTDLAKLAYALATGKVLNPQLTALMFGPPPDHQDDDRSQIRGVGAFHYRKWPYGMGWFLLTDGVHHFWHTHGHFTGTNAFVVRDWHNNIFVAIFNKTSPSMHNVQLMRRYLQTTFLSVVDGSGVIRPLYSTTYRKHRRLSHKAVHHPVKRKSKKTNKHIVKKKITKKKSTAHTAAMIPPPKQTVA